MYSEDGMVIIEDSLINYSLQGLYVESYSLHRLQMNNVQFANNIDNRISIYKLDFIEDATLSSQPGLEGYYFEAPYGRHTNTLPENITLTVEEGVNLFFAEMQVDGHLQVNGTVTNPVTLTKEDDEYRTFISLSETGSLSMTHNLIQGQYAPLYIEGESDKQVSLQDTLFTYEDDYGINITADAFPRLQLDRVAFDGPGDKRVMIYVDDYYNPLTENMTLKPLPGLNTYELWSYSPVRIPENVALTVEAGTVLQVDNSGMLVEGTLISKGTAQAPVTFEKTEGTPANAWLGIDVSGGHMQLDNTIIQDAMYGVDVLSGTAQIKYKQICYAGIAPIIDKTCSGV